MKPLPSALLKLGALLFLLTLVSCKIAQKHPGAELSTAPVMELSPLLPELDLSHAKNEIILGKSFHAPLYRIGHRAEHAKHLMFSQGAAYLVNASLADESIVGPLFIRTGGDALGEIVTQQENGQVVAVRNDDLIVDITRVAFTNPSSTDRSVAFFLWRYFMNPAAEAGSPENETLSLEQIDWLLKNPDPSVLEPVSCDPHTKVCHYLLQDRKITLSGSLHDLLAKVIQKPVSVAQSNVVPVKKMNRQPPSPQLRVRSIASFQELESALSRGASERRDVAFISLGDPASCLPCQMQAVDMNKMLPNSPRILFLKANIDVAMQDPNLVRALRLNEVATYPHSVLVSIDQFSSGMGIRAFGPSSGMQGNRLFPDDITRSAETVRAVAGNGTAAGFAF